MDETDPSHGVGRGRTAERKRGADEEPGNGENDYAKHVDPVTPADRQLPYVSREFLLVWHDWPPFLAYLDLHQLAPSGIDDMNGASQAWVKGVNGAQDLQRLVRIGNRRPHQKRPRSISCRCRDARREASARVCRRYIPGIPAIPAAVFSPRQAPARCLGQRIRGGMTHLIKDQHGL